MSSAAVAELPLVTLADYLAAEDVSEVRHEWVGGRVYAMSGGTERHGLMAGEVSAALRAGVRAAGCRYFQEGQRLFADRASYYPDVFVVCGPRGHAQYETDAVLVVEVLSPSTRHTDRREKTKAYASLPSLQLYVLVDPDRRHVEVAEPTPEGLRWTSYGPGGVVTTPYGPLSVDDLHASLDVMVSTLPT